MSFFCSPGGSDPTRKSTCMNRQSSFYSNGKNSKVNGSGGVNELLISDPKIQGLPKIKLTYLRNSFRRQSEGSQPNNFMEIVVNCRRLSAESGKKFYMDICTTNLWMRTIPQVFYCLNDNDDKCTNSG